MIWDEKLNLLVKKEADGSLDYGDAPAETFRYYHLVNVRARLGLPVPGVSIFPEQVWASLISIRSNDGYKLQRAPTALIPDSWEPKPPTRDFPQDQTVAVLMGLGAFEFSNFIKLYVNERGSFYQNGQPILGDGRAVMRRAVGNKSNNFLDAFIWPTVLNRCGMVPFWDNGTKTIEWHNENKVQDIMNLVHWFFQCEYRGVTWQSEKARLFLKKNCWKPGIMGQIRLYCSDKPDLADLYEPLIARVF